MDREYHDRNRSHASVHRLRREQRRGAPSGFDLFGLATKPPEDAPPHYVMIRVSPDMIGYCVCGDADAEQRLAPVVNAAFRAALKALNEIEAQEAASAEARP